MLHDKKTWFLTSTHCGKMVSVRLEDWLVGRLIFGHTYCTETCRPRDPTPGTRVSGAAYESVGNWSRYCSTSTRWFDLLAGASPETARDKRAKDEERKTESSRVETRRDERESRDEPDSATIAWRLRRRNVSATLTRRVAIASAQTVALAVSRSLFEDTQ